MSHAAFTGSQPEDSRGLGCWQRIRTTKVSAPPIFEKLFIAALKHLIDSLSLNCLYFSNGKKLLWL